MYFPPQENKAFLFKVCLKVQQANLQKECRCHFSLITALLVTPVENQGQ